LCCVGPNRNAAIADQILSLIQGELDWDYLYLLARRHSLLPLLYSALRQQAHLIPADQFQRLENSYQENLARCVVMTSEMIRVVGLLGANGMEAIPYKGPALALFAYGDVALRRFVDLDIMVRREDVDRAVELLLDDGYELAQELTREQRELLSRTQHNLQFRRYNRQLIVELHWEVASQHFASSVQAEDFWRDLDTQEIDGTKLKTLSAGDLLFSLTVHGSRHCWERLLWLCDIAWLVSRHELNWDSLLARAKANNNERMFLLGLYLCEKLFQVGMPELIEREFEKDPQLDRLSAMIVEGLFNGVVHTPATPMEIFRYNLNLRKSWSSRARYLRHMLGPTDGDVHSVALPKRFAFAYYLTRPFRLIFKSNESPR
jgi:hypothetical protein